MPMHRTPWNILTETWLSSGFDDDGILLLLIGEIFLNVFLSTSVCAIFTHRM